MKRRRSIVEGLLLMAITAVSFPSRAQQSLGLQDAIRMSMKNSSQLKTAQARIEEAQAATREALDRRLPDASVSGSYLRLNQPTVKMQTKSSSSGGSGSGSETAKPNQAIYGMANVSLPLYAGSRIRYGIESSRLLEKATRLDAEADREEVIFTTIESYNNLYKAQSAVKLVQENLEAARQRAKDFASLEKNGLLARNELMKAQLQASNTELALLDAENNWKLANLNMNLLLGLPDTTVLMLDSTAFRNIPQVKPLEDYVQAGLHERRDLAALDYRKQAAQTGVKAIQGEKYPSLALTGGYVALDVPKVLTVTNAVNIGLGVKYDLASLWKNKARVQQAQARARQAEIGETMMSDAIRLQVNQAYQSFLSGQKKIQVYSLAVEQANENFRIVNNKFNNKLATTTELLEADAARLQAQMNYSFAQSDALVAYNRLLQTAGLLNLTETK